MYCENFDFADEEFKSIVEESYRTLPIQVIATMTSVSDCECSLFDYFDIFYKCKDNANSVFSKGKCMEVISKAKYERSSWDSGQHTIGRENSFKHFWYKQDVWETYKNSTPSLTTRRYMKISRSLSDIDCSCCVRESHFIEAQKYCVYDNN